ncbi:MAG TPA: hypothetical protein VF665_05805 [Longimicrobium sp.]|uniref:hypothetical protein n=1 Tax=Longimicrobium sp. TaxID=2029185 RepID=UPI002EDA4A94
MRFTARPPTRTSHALPLRGMMSGVASASGTLAALAAVAFFAAGFRAGGDAFAPAVAGVERGVMGRPVSTFGV